MEYTKENFEQDRRIAHYVFNKYMDRHQYKDDLIQVALIGLWRLRESRKYKDYVRCAITTAHNEMLMYIRQNKNYLQVESLDAEIYKDLRLLDVTPCEYNSLDTYLLRSDIIRKIKPLLKKVSPLERKITLLYLKHYKQTEIAEKVGVTQQYISLVIKQFRLTISKLLN